MANFSSIKEMLEKMLLPIANEVIEKLEYEGETLELTTTLLADGGEELIFSHEKLDIPFDSIQVIVDPLFFRQNAKKIIENYDRAYHGIAKNPRWESIGISVKKGISVNVNQLSFISLYSSFEGNNKSKQIKLKDIIKNVTFPDIKNRILVTLSFEEAEKDKKKQIEDAKKTLSSLFKDPIIKTFEIDKRGGGYYGFIALF